MSAMPPIIDLAAWFSNDRKQQLEFSRQVGQVAHETGFFYVINHGIPLATSEAYLQAIKSFFALPLTTR